MTTKPVVYTVPGMDAVTVETITYRADLQAHVYLPPGATLDERRPAVVFVSGYPDPGFVARLGCRLEDMAQYTSWARLVAASGLAAITYANRTPVEDLDALFAHLHSRGLDGDRLGLWAASGNVPAALGVLRSQPVRCAALCYGYMLGEAVSQAAAQIGFAEPDAGWTLDDLPASLPLLVVRAGADHTPRLNETLDRFVTAALARNLPLTLINHASAPHAFDILDDGDRSRQVIKQVLDFLRFELTR